MTVGEWLQLITAAGAVLGAAGGVVWKLGMLIRDEFKETRTHHMTVTDKQGEHFQNISVAQNAAFERHVGLLAEQHAADRKAYMDGLEALRQAADRERFARTQGG